MKNLVPKVLLRITSYNVCYTKLLRRLFCWIMFVRVKIEGLENLNRKQSYVVACNHQSMYDIFVIYGWLPMFFKWIMKAELRKIPLVGKACESAGHIFINRSSAMAAKHSLEKAEAQLQNGVSVVVFPVV